MSSGLWPIQVFYDGACPVCSRQKRQWETRDRHGRLEFVDIADPEFDSGEYGLDSEAIQRSLHVRTADRRVFTGIEAVRVIWTAFPGMWGAAFLAGFPGIHRLLDLGYRVLARNRHFLTGPCDDGTCGVEEEGEDPSDD